MIATRVWISLLLACAAMTAAHAEAVIAERDARTSDVLLANETVRMRFPYGKPVLGKFPLGYTGYALDLKTADGWTTMGRVPYFTVYNYRSDWGRDWVQYPLPQVVDITHTSDSAMVRFTQETALSQGAAKFIFEFKLRAGAPTIEASYKAMPLEPSPLLMFRGPWLYAGDSSFGTDKDEALFPGLEYLGRGEESSQQSSLAMEIRNQSVPDPARISVPLMVVRKGEALVGLMWDPMQRWLREEATPSAMFASPNWIERQPNHLLGIFAPSVPKYVVANAMRAQQPLDLAAGETVTLRATLFAMQGRHATDAVELYLQHRGGLPAPQQKASLEDAAAVEMLVRGITARWDPASKGWPWTIGAPQTSNAQVIAALLTAAPLLRDPALARTAREQAEAARAASKGISVALALQCGGVDKVLAAHREEAERILKQQADDGSWGATPSPEGEFGLAVWLSPPVPGRIARAGERTQGITAGYAALLMKAALLTADPNYLAGGLRGIADMNRYTIPYVSWNEECPPAPSLHGAFNGLRACRAAYLITGDAQYLDSARYWARTGLPFIYLWSMPAKAAPKAHIHSNNPPYLRAEDVYENTTRDAMGYAALYGFGSSQYLHHWFGIAVHWIGLEYALALHDFAALDPNFDWPRVIDGLLVSGLWQSFDKAPFMGYMPDGFNLETWVPSGPAINPTALLDTMLICRHGLDDPQTQVVAAGPQRLHLTALAKIEKVQAEAGIAKFEATLANADHQRIIVAGVPELKQVAVDGHKLDRVTDLESVGEGWQLLEGNMAVVKAAHGGKALRYHLIW